MKPDKFSSSRLGVLNSHFSSAPAMASEKEVAVAAVPSDSPTIFDKIINKEIPSTVVYEDDKVYGDMGIQVISAPSTRAPLWFIGWDTFCSATEIPHLHVLAFRDIAPQAPTHILIIPKVKDGLTGLSKAEERHCEILGYLLYTAKCVAKQEGLDDGFRIVINDGPRGCQSVYHIHVHLLGGRQMNWPPG